jgi:hypothetical protein
VKADHASALCRSRNAGSTFPQALNRLRKNSSLERELQALYQGTTSVVPQTALNQQGLQPLLIWRYRKSHFPQPVLAPEGCLSNSSSKSRPFPQPAKPAPPISV